MGIIKHMQFKLAFSYNSIFRPFLTHCSSVHSFSHVRLFLTSQLQRMTTLAMRFFPGENFYHCLFKVLIYNL